MTAKYAALAQFMVSISQEETLPEFFTQLSQAFPHTLKYRLVAHPNKSCITGKIPVGDGEITRAGFLQELVQKVVLLQRSMHPEEATVEVNARAQQRVRHDAKFITVAPRAFGCAGIMNIAQDGEPDGFGHWCAKDGNSTGRRQERQGDPERGAFSRFTVSCDVAVMILHNPPGHGQPQPRPRWLGSKKRFE